MSTILAIAKNPCSQIALDIGIHRTISTHISMFLKVSTRLGSQNNLLYNCCTPTPTFCLSFHVHFETWPFYLLQLQFILFNTAAYNLHKAFISSPYIALASVSERFIRKKNCMSLSNWSKFISPTLLFTWSMTDWIRPFCFLLNCLGVEEGAKSLTLLNMFSWSTLSRKLYSFSHGRCCL